ncbi:MULTISPECIES: PilZ domain-containing protein [Cohnella]|uniref:PilZ domain-containing protein n=1 Tax=Cohnella TaxID=329857 RepID=UPI0009B9DF46|nr:MULTISPECIES: PilZ domain-containing protein [Cohnella]MBN2980322.1 PilZ domain-containing protein [Cohnella algarum]
MTMSRRNEPFRYAFHPGQPCLIRPYEINGNRVASGKQAEATMLDLSQGGGKLETALNFRLSHNECKIVLSLNLTRTLELRGTLVWEERRAHDYQYGVRFDDAHRQEITDELKAFAKLKHQQAEEAKLAHV